MVLYAVLFALTAAAALPLDSSGGNVLIKHDQELAAAQANSGNLPSARTVFGIVWGCLTTIFACTWLAIHPNIPGPDDSRWKILLRRTMIMMLAIVLPEYTTVWALRQWRAARRVSKEIFQRKDLPEWTITHSFFLIMGGFVIVDEEGKHRGCIVSIQNLLALKDKWNSFRVPTERAILDRSKGDVLSKTLILLHTTWFLLQVLTRFISRLPVTELELITVAFASLNILAYTFWYNKPLNVDCPVEVMLPSWIPTPEWARISQRPGLDPRDREQTLSEFRSAIRFNFNHSTSTMNEQRNTIIVSHDDTTVQEVSFTGFESSTLTTTSTLEEAPHHTGTPSVADTSLQVKNDTGLVRWRVVQHIRTMLKVARKWHILPSLPSAIIVEVLYPGFRTSKGSDSGHSPVQVQVPTFYDGSESVGGVELSRISGFFQIALAIYFGGVHCAAWNFVFPTEALCWVWRIFALILTAVPFYLAVANSDIGRKCLMVPLWRGAFRVFCALLACLYFAARLTLVVLPFVLLRDLPPRTLEDVGWTRYFPHLPIPWMYSQ